MNNKFKSRFQQKIGTTAEWDKAAEYGFVPLKGEIIIYQDFDTDGAPRPPQFKVGDGIGTLRALPFSVPDLKNIECDSLRVVTTHSQCGFHIGTNEGEGRQTAELYTTDGVSAGSFHGSCIHLNGGSGQGEIVIEGWNDEDPQNPIMTSISSDEALFGGSISITENLTIGQAQLDEEKLLKLLALTELNLATGVEVLI